MNRLVLTAALLTLSLGLPHLTGGSAHAQSEQIQSETKAKPYAHKNTKGKTYYLFSRQQSVKNSDKTFTMYFFASDPENKKGTPVAAVPADRQVSETKTGLLVLKKKK